MVRGWAIPDHNGNGGLTLLLVHTAETDFNRCGRLQGDIDIPLTDRGRTSSAKLVDDRTGSKVAAIYASGNQGARETAEIIASTNGGRVRILKGLRGVSLGLWEGQLRADVSQRHSRMYARWRRDPLSITPPEGEPMTDAFERAGIAARSIRKKHKAGTVVVVAQRTMIALLYCHLKGESANRVHEIASELEPVLAVPGHSGG